MCNKKTTPPETSKVNGENQEPTISELNLVKRDIELQRRAFEVEKKAETESKSFVEKYAAILVPAALSFAALIVTGGQVWSTYISNDLDRQSSDSRAKRELDISAAKLIVENSPKIFNGTTEEKDMYGLLISTLYPSEVAMPLLLKMKAADDISVQGDKQQNSMADSPWDKALSISVQDSLALSSDKSLLVKQNGYTLQVWNLNSKRLVVSVQAPGNSDILSASFSNDNKLVTLITSNGSYVLDLISGRISNSNPPIMGDLKDGINLYAGDLKKIVGVENADACIKLCSDDVKCVAITFVKRGFQGKEPVCYLKNKVPPARKDDCCVSAVKNIPSK